MQIRGAVVVVTGASSGIGRETALALAGKGARLVLAARRAAELEETANDCRKRGGDCRAFDCDVAEEKRVEALARFAVETYGRIDAWVNNAGIYAMGTVQETPEKAFRRVINVNLFGVVHGTRAALPHLARSKGVLVNISSALGRVSGPYVSAYAASKHAVRAFTESVRDETRHQGISVTTVYPPAIDTPLFQHSANYTGRRIKPANPIFPPDRVAKAIVSAIERPKREILVAATKLMSAFHTLLPGAFERYMTFQMERDHFDEGAAAISDGNIHAPMHDGSRSDGGWIARQRRSLGRSVKIAGAMPGIFRQALASA
ncbi:MAG: SDR family NAD(P)-dependent oxidoreductase [Myxococcales bacterium]